jgi:hypothetical protein
MGFLLFYFFYKSGVNIVQGNQRVNEIAKVLEFRKQVAAARWRGGEKNLTAMGFFAVDFNEAKRYKRSIPFNSIL